MLISELISEELEKVKDQDGLGLRRVAKQLGCSPSTLESWAKGWRPPSLDRSKAIAEFVNQPERLIRELILRERGYLAENESLAVSGQGKAAGLVTQLARPKRTKTQKASAKPAKKVGRNSERGEASIVYLLTEPCYRAYTDKGNFTCGNTTVEVSKLRKTA